MIAAAAAQRAARRHRRCNFKQHLDTGAGPRHRAVSDQRRALRGKHVYRARSHRRSSLDTPSSAAAAATAALYSLCLDTAAGSSSSNFAAAQRLRAPSSPRPYIPSISCMTMGGADAVAVAWPQPTNSAAAAAHKAPPAVRHLLHSEVTAAGAMTVEAWTWHMVYEHEAPISILVMAMGIMLGSIFPERGPAQRRTPAAGVCAAVLESAYRRGGQHGLCGSGRPLVRRCAGPAHSHCLVNDAPSAAGPGGPRRVSQLFARSSSPKWRGLRASLLGLTSLRQGFQAASAPHAFDGPQESTDHRGGQHGLCGLCHPVEAPMCRTRAQPLSGSKLALRSRSSPANSLHRQPSDVAGASSRCMVSCRLPWRTQTKAPRSPCTVHKPTAANAMAQPGAMAAALAPSAVASVGTGPNAAQPRPRRQPRSPKRSRPRPARCRPQHGPGPPRSAPRGQRQQRRPRRCPQATRLVRRWAAPTNADHLAALQPAPSQVFRSPGW